eukprot:4860542-Alexandrium_andersonii.AAC.1
MKLLYASCSFRLFAGQLEAVEQLKDGRPRGFPSQMLHAQLRIDCAGLEPAHVARHLCELL